MFFVLALFIGISPCFILHFLQSTYLAIYLVLQFLHTRAESSSKEIEVMNNYFKYWFPIYLKKNGVVRRPFGISLHINNRSLKIGERHRKYQLDRVLLKRGQKIL